MLPFIDQTTLNVIRDAIEHTHVEKAVIQRMIRVSNGRGGWTPTVTYGGEFPARLATPQGRMGEHLIAAQISERVPYRLYYPIWVGMFPPPAGTPDPPMPVADEDLPVNPGNYSVWFTAGDQLLFRNHTWDVQAVEQEVTIGYARIAVIWLRLGSPPVDSTKP